MVLKLVKIKFMVLVILVVMGGSFSVSRIGYEISDVNFVVVLMIFVIILIMIKIMINFLNVNMCNVFFFFNSFIIVIMIIIVK